MDNEEVDALINHPGTTIVLALLMLGSRHLNDIVGETTFLGARASDFFFAITAGLTVANLAYTHQIRFFQPVEEAHAIGDRILRLMPEQYKPLHHVPYLFS